MSFISARQKKIAILLLVVFLVNLIVPSVSYALTSGPAQPETKGFQPAGVSDMVDLQIGDFKYNIPLLDIDGYPINLSYASGVNMDDEASWVGLGWSLNPGTINRQVRGLPDDFAGDQVATGHYTKPMVTVGGRVTGKVELFGKGVVKSGPKGGGSLSFGVYKNNYTGIGGELAVNAGVSLSSANDGTMTAGLGFGLSSNTQSGVDFSPYASLSVGQMATDHVTGSAGLSASLGYNSRSGLKSLALAESFTPDIPARGKNSAGQETGASFEMALSGNSSISYNTEPINPRVQVPYTSDSKTFSIDGGYSFLTAFIGGGFSGYRNIRSVLHENFTNPGYGFLYAERGKNDPDAMMDFIREKENPVVAELPNLAVPIQTPDLFSYTSQGGSGQFRLYRGGTGMFFDNQAEDQNSNSSFGIDVGLGINSWHAGVTYYQQEMHNKTHKWVNDNQYRQHGDFQDPDNTNPNKQHVFFKVSGEKNQQDDDIDKRIGYTDPVKIDIDGKTAYDHPFYGSNLTPVDISRDKRQPVKTVISYLTASEATSAAVDKNIMTYPVNQDGSFIPPADHKVVGTPLARVDDDHKAHHISEITVTDEGGKRQVYGIPVYNIKQDEYSFAIGKEDVDYTVEKNGSVSKNLTNSYEDGSNHTLKLGHDRGVDNYYHKESKPAYATSFLLTSILSPDYIDKTGDGITDDDLGTAIKFHYSKNAYAYKWRAPYQGATINRGLLADDKDDKGSIIYGEKELWYISSIESKTKIAYFITKERDDALGVTDWLMGGKGTGTAQGQKQRCLTEIRLYSKADMKPIKIVKFDYTYELCPNIPNNINGGGKLTLKSVWFEYGNIHKGSNHKYNFTYAYDNESISSANPDYGFMLTDRWGVYKTPDRNLANGFNLQNDEFPYADQDKNNADNNVAKWHLKRIDLPTGGTINVKYEADDYAYVQNRKAMRMYKIDRFINDDRSLIDVGDAAALINAQGVRLAIGTSPDQGEDHTTWFKKNYLDGSDYMYTKVYARVATNNYDNTHNGSDPGGNIYDYDFIPCYAKIRDVVVNGSYALVRFEQITEGGAQNKNPIIIAAWQKIKNDYPKYAYPGYDNYTTQNSIAGDVSDAISSLITAIGNISELFQSFYEKAGKPGNNYAGAVNIDKSFVRLAINVSSKDTQLGKIGGGARVKMISISDNWEGMSGNVLTGLGTYGQSYDYTTRDNGQLTSTGVATYEPSIGNDENPFKQPVPYMQKIKGAINNYFDLEEPFGESVFPAPTITYSKVTVTDLNNGVIAAQTPKTGYIVNEFYTSKDFPVKVHVLPINTIHIQPANYFSFVKTTSDDELTMSQGYSIDLNDMNGKTKATRVFNQSGAQVSATEYYYKSTDTGGGEFTLDNKVKVVKPDGTVTDAVMGRDIEMFTDFREQESSNKGLNINLGLDVVLVFVFPLYIPHFPIAANDDYKLFRSACAFKVVQSYGILDKVVKTDNGSSITTQNMAFDGVTGDALITKTQNEFNNDIYSVNIPAYWAYNGMGPAYKNLGALFSGFTTDVNGKINPSYASYFTSGDEIIDLDSHKDYYVLDIMSDNNGNVSYAPVAPGSGGYLPNNGTFVNHNKYLMDRAGSYYPISPSLIKVVRSGYRNQLGASITNIVCLNNPVVTDANGLQHLSIAQSGATGNLKDVLKVINASATTYDENWSVEQPDYHLVENKAFRTVFDEYANLNPSLESDGTNQAHTDTKHFEYNMNNYNMASIDADYHQNDPGNFYLAFNFNEHHDYVTSYEGILGAYYHEFDYNPIRYPNGYPYGQYYGHDDGFYSNYPFKWYHNTNYDDNYNSYDSFYTHNFLANRLENCGVEAVYLLLDANYPGGRRAIPSNIHIPTSFYVPVEGDYFIGYGGTTNFSFTIDDCDGGFDNPYTPHPVGADHWNWFISGPTHLTKGLHSINFTVSGWGLPYGYSTYFGAEIYNFPNNNAPDLNNINIIYNTRTLKDATDLQIYVTDPTTGANIDSHYYYTDPQHTPGTKCILPPTTINPFIYGFKGNWRPYETKVFQQSRLNNSVQNAVGPVDVKNAGYINDFYTNWYCPSINAPWVQNTVTAASGKWVTANTVTVYDKYGQQLENKDALNRYSAAQFNFNGELPSAVASNAINREIYANGFEDYKFKPGSSIYVDISPYKEFLGGGAEGGQRFDQLLFNPLSAGGVQVSHTGNYCVVLPDEGMVLATKVFSDKQRTKAYLNFDSKNQLVKDKTTLGLYPNGFEPQAQQYIFDVWVKAAGVPQAIDNSLGLKVNGTAVTLKCKAVVEGWKLIEGTIDLTGFTNGQDVSIALDAPGIYIDDLRIHPKDSQMKTYAYDDRSMRLMAELDENCMATFYEYDDEGLLVRVKKETERGVVTLKESRSSYKNKP